MPDYRMMTAMVVFKFEQALGTFVHQRIQKIDETIEDIATSILGRKAEGHSISDISPRQLIAETYIEDLFQLALKITKDTADHGAVNEIKRLSANLSLNEIRNAVAHPNRPFPECYWYRAAAIISDPLVHQLNLQELAGCLDAALAGRIEAPPEDWLKQPEWVISNDLPKTSDFDITGLIGRPKEISELQKYLLNPRVNTIAVVAPGGVGKTALVLDVLNRVSKTPEFHKIFSAISFVTLKIERLTSEGLIKLDAPASIAQLQLRLAATVPALFGEEQGEFDFEGIKDRFGGYQLLLFIDNLETILLDDPADFTEFQISLPPLWRLIVTSRIAINSATCLTLAPLTEAHAKSLTRVYSIRRGASAVLNDDAVSKVILRTRCNPLAIRLTVDAYILGSSLEDSSTLASRDVLSFSYRNLLDVISKESCAVLECLVLEDLQTRMELAENISCSIDAVAAGLAELGRTSLIVRNHDGEQEKYSLYPAVRDILLVQPRDENLRKLIQHRLLSIKESLAEDHSRQSKLTRFHIEYVEPDLPNSVRNICFESNRILRQPESRRRQSVLPVIERLRTLKEEYPRLPAIPYQLAKLFKSLGDNRTAIAEAQGAIALVADDAQSMVLLARCLHDERDYSGASEAYKKVKDIEGWNPAVAGLQMARYCYNGYLLALLYARANQKILDETHDWQNLENLKDLAGAFRARAWKRSIEQNSEMEAKAKALSKSAAILDELHKQYGYMEWFPGFFQEIIRGIAEGFKVASFSATKYALKLLDFVDQHITNVFSDSGADLETVLSVAESLVRIQVRENPFHSRDWSDFLKTKGGRSFADVERKATLLEDGYVLATVYHLPRDGLFVFAKDQLEKQYFIHFESVVPENRRLWDRIREGTELALKAEDMHPGPNQAHKAAITVIL